VRRERASRIVGDGEVTLARKLWRRGRDLFPTAGFQFDRPLVLLQSDDWGRVGLRDQEGLEQLRRAGIALGERAYDFYTLETADDLGALSDTLKRHHDSVGQSPSLEMNFILGNLDFPTMSAEGFQKVRMLSLAEGLPAGWHRPGLLEAYREGIADGVFCAALHGMTHFCQAAVERNLAAGGERAVLLRTLWQAGAPYIHWRMPWIGYEYWDPEKPDDERFLSPEVQRSLIGQAVGGFAKMFATLPRSACAPGYRADDQTNRAWAQHGIRVAQNGPGRRLPPHFEDGVLQVCRTIEFEPAVQMDLSVEACVRQAEGCFERGIPAIVCLHSINFHSTVRDFRSRTLQLLDEFLTVLESKHSDLLYLRDEELCEIVTNGSYQARQERVAVKVRRRTFIKGRVA